MKNIRGEKRKEKKLAVKRGNAIGKADRDMFRDKKNQQAIFNRVWEIKGREEQIRRGSQFSTDCQ